MEKVHWYELLFRGISPGAFPKDAITTEHSYLNSRGLRFGAVAFNRPLTSAEIADYELKEVKSVRDLEGWELSLI